MIKIQYPENRLEFHQRYIEALGINDEMREEFKKWTNNLYSLDDVLIKSIEDLYIFSKEIKYIHFPSENLENLKQILNYDTFQQKIKTFFEKELKIKTCYYCNIDFINAFNDISDYHDFDDFLQRADKNDLMKIKGIAKKRANNIISQRPNAISNKTFNDLEAKYSHFTLDHVLDKATYPLIALSLYNFVPSCYACNSKFKKNKQFITNHSTSFLSPTSNNFSFDEDVKFKLFFYNGKSISDIREKNDYILDFEYLRYEDEYKKYIDTFKLKGRYIFHKDEVIEMIKLKEKYSKSQIKEISDIVKSTSMQVKKDIFGKELFEDNLVKKSMSKFRKDIAKNLKII
jgi:hypothetical protein